MSPPDVALIRVSYELHRTLPDGQVDPTNLGSAAHTFAAYGDDCEGQVKEIIRHLGEITRATFQHAAGPEGGPGLQGNPLPMRGFAPGLPGDRARRDGPSG